MDLTSVYHRTGALQSSGHVRSLRVGILYFGTVTFFTVVIDSGFMYVNVTVLTLV